MIFEGQFEASQQRIADLENLERVVFLRSIHAIVQWLNIRVDKFGIEENGEYITTAAKFVRLTDIYDIAQLETAMAQYGRDIITVNSHPQTADFGLHVDNNS